MVKGACRRHNHNLYDTNRPSRILRNRFELYSAVFDFSALFCCNFQKQRGYNFVDWFIPELVTPAPCKYVQACFSGHSFSFWFAYFPKGMYIKLFLCAWQRLALIDHITKANHDQPEPSDKIHKFLTHKLNYALSELFYFFPPSTNLQPQMQYTNYVDHKYKISTNFDT